MVNQSDINTLKTKYRVRSFVGQKESMRRAIKIIGDALRFPDFNPLNSVGVPFTGWQQLYIKLLFRFGFIATAQKAILNYMMRKGLIK